ncbi:MAG: helix-turn-helix domain-containing protein [Bacteroidota bacterium]
MAQKSPVLLPKMKKIMAELGENIKLARLRRKLSAQQVAERAGISRSTLHSIEKGYEGVSIGYYLSVLNVLGLEKDFLTVASDDELGRKIQDANLSTKERAPKKK